MADGGSAAARLWALTDLRQRWKALVVLGVLAGVTGGFAMAALAGARRADTALPRFREGTDAADAIVFASQAGVPHPDWDKLRARPEVADVAVWNLMFGAMEQGVDDLLFVADDDGFAGRVSRPVVVEGRMWNPDATDEVVVSEGGRKNVPLGSTIDFQPFGADQGDSADAPSGPKVRFHVVGVVRTLNQFLFTDQILVGPGFKARYGSEVQLAENADVRLRHGSADIPALQRDVNEVVAPGTPVLDLHAVSRRVSTTVSVEHAALLMLAIAVAVAGGLLVAQAHGRSASVIADDVRVLRAIGMKRADMAVASTLSHGATAIVAVVVALATAVAASPLFPIGMSRRIEPDVGMHADWAVLLPGLALVSVLLVGRTALLAGRAARDVAPALASPSAIVSAVRGRAPLTVGLGTTMALETGAGRNRVAVRPALVGAIVGVLGVVGALTIEHAVNDALTHPERAGVEWDAQVVPLPSDLRSNGIDSAIVESVQAALPPGSAVAAAARFIVEVNGVGVPSFSLDALSSEQTPPIAFALTAGRAPRTDDEVALGPKTARDVDAEIGDTVAIGDGATPVRVVGLALFPPDVHAEFDEGMWVPRHRFESLVPHVSAEDLFQGADRALFVRFPSGTDVDQTLAGLGEELGDRTEGVFPADVPAELTNLRNVRTMPLLLAAFLGLLAIAAVSHVLVTTARRRYRDFAVLRTIGLNRRGTRLILAAQSTAIGIVGLLFGVPLGVAVGRAIWRWVADLVPLEEVPPFALLAVVVIVPATVALVNALAVWPGRHVSRVRPAEVLRAE